MRKKILFISKVLLILLFVSYYGAVTAFMHTHYSPEYGIITHSHPFSGEHSHTQTQYETIYSLSNFLSSPQVAFFSACISILIGVIFLIKSYVLPRLYYAFHSLRAPPSFA
ncbi:MAG: hypothetical protein LLG05_00300 [Porphyromonadaceae bacterium]|nr:hypothetical protein [Porphyromonadaceae bacterium]